MYSNVKAIIDNKKIRDYSKPKDMPESEYQKKVIETYGKHKDIADNVDLFKKKLKIHIMVSRVFNQRFNAI